MVAATVHSTLVERTSSSTVHFTHQQVVVMNGNWNDTHTHTTNDTTHRDGIGTQGFRGTPARRTRSAHARSVAAQRPRHHLPATAVPSLRLSTALLVSALSIVTSTVTIPTTRTLTAITVAAALAPHQPHDPTATALAAA
jgi:hypothetical protein